MSKDELAAMDFDDETRRTLPLNHRATFTKDIPGAAGYAQAMLVNQQYRYRLNLAQRSRKPISKMGIHEDP